MIRVVVSGLGVVSPYGAGAKTFWAGLTTGECAIRPVTVIATEGFRSRIAAEVPADVVASLGVSRRRSRADRIALTAAREALAEADLAPGDRADMGLFIGAVGGGMLEGEEWYCEQAAGRGPSPRIGALRSILPVSHAETLAWRLRLGGPRETVVMACASGAASIALGADLIRSGATPLVLAGGVDAITRICFMGFNALKLLDPEPCRPFDRGRRGMSIGEAAAFVVLEDAEHCRARGARVLGELLGAGMTTDAHHVTAPHPEGEGMVRAMADALAAAGRAPADIGYVNAHGTGTLLNDKTETLALRKVFGAHAERLAISSSKGVLGHSLGAAGALEAAATALTLHTQTIPPTANFEEVDPDCDLDFVPNVGRQASVRAAISNSFAFGGLNAVLAFGRA